MTGSCQGILSLLSLAQSLMSPNYTSRRLRQLRTTFEDSHDGYLIKRISVFMVASFDIQGTT